VTPNPSGCGRVNGETRQDSCTSETIFSVAYLIHYLSKGMTLESSDVLLTGTPPRFVQSGDVVECEVESPGNRVTVES